MPCDTVCFSVLESPKTPLTSARYIVFLKNSDRHPNEEQVTEAVVPSTTTDVSEGDSPRPVRCTYLTIPGVRLAPGNVERYRVILSRPTHQWGAEMGCNEWGLCLGNEAIFTDDVPVNQAGANRSSNATYNIGTAGPWLTGLDLLRLALERSKNKMEAIEVIATLVGEHDGHGGDCGFDGHAFYYHNGFVLCDATSASPSSLRTTLEPAAAESASPSRYSLGSSSRAAIAAHSMAVMLVFNKEWIVVRPDATGGWCDGSEHASLSNAIPEGIKAHDILAQSPGFEALMQSRRCSHHDDATTDVRTRLLQSFGFHKLCDLFGRGLYRQCRTKARTMAVIEGHYRRAAAGAEEQRASFPEEAAAAPDMTGGQRQFFRLLSDSIGILTDHGMPVRDVVATPAPVATRTVPREGPFDVNVCMHAGAGPVRINATTASLVVVLRVPAPVPPSLSSLSSAEVVVASSMLVFTTGTSLPCLSVFKPIGFDCGRGTAAVPWFSEDDDDGLRIRTTRPAACSLWLANELLLVRPLLRVWSASQYACRIALWRHQCDREQQAVLRRATIQFIPTTEPPLPSSKTMSRMEAKAIAAAPEAATVVSCAGQQCEFRDAMTAHCALLVRQFQCCASESGDAASWASSGEPSAAAAKSNASVLSKMMRVANAVASDQWTASLFRLHALPVKKGASAADDPKGTSFPSSELLRSLAEARRVLGVQHRRTLMWLRLYAGCGCVLLAAMSITTLRGFLLWEWPASTT